MDVDLLKHQSKWKESLREIRSLVAEVEEHGFKETRGWHAHWDRQLYKVLDYQYQLGLQSISDHLPEIPVQIEYR